MIKSQLFSTILALFISTSSFAVSQDSSQNAIQKSIQKILENMNHPDVAPGAIIASPSRHDPDYFFHWTRDAGLTVLTLLGQIENYPQLIKPIQQWSLFEQFTQTQAMKSNTGGGLGEPKFLVTGEVFTGPWGRPQNDGPAIRLLANLKAFHNIDQFVEADITYLLKNWQVPNFDLWEEVKGHHFFTRYSQMTAFRYAAVHYQAQLHQKNAEALFREANKIEKSLHGFIDPNLHVVRPTLPGSEGVQKPHGLDISVILALNYFGTTAQAHTDNTPDWSYSQPSVLYTAYKISESFKNIYDINKKFPDMAPGIGRYPEDVYDGNGFSGGNPWFLATFGMAEYYCALVMELLEKGSLAKDSLSQAFYSHILSSQKIKKSSQSQDAFTTTLKAIQQKALSSIQRSVFHGGLDGHYSEQFDRSSGFKRGAADLTWSYASKIRAIGRCQSSEQLLKRSGR